MVEYSKETVKKGEWYIGTIDRVWYIFRKGYQQKKKIGKVRMSGTNYHDIAREEAKARNKKIARGKK